MSDQTGSFINTRIGRYDVRERIGTGGMARVFKAWDSNLDRWVAVKILHEHLAEDTTFKERFEREARFIAGFNNPHIVQVYDFDSIKRDGRVISYMVMPYMPGPTLKERLEELAQTATRLSRDQILSIMLNLTDALGYAHGRGMVHRNVKPANVLFNEYDQAVLTDFGIARLVAGARLTQEGLTSGTPTYMSPEQVTGGDLYALGIMLYEMLAGQPPFNDENTLSVMLNHVQMPVPPVSTFLSMGDPNFDALIFKALAKNPDDRYQTASEFAADLRRVFAGQPPGLVPAEPTPHTEAPHLASSRGATDIPASANSEPVRPHSTRPNRLRSPLGILAVGMAAIITLAVLGLLSRALDNQPTPPLPTPTTSVSSMVGDSEPRYFADGFNPNDAYNVGWPQDDSGSLIRRITPDGFYTIATTLTDSVATTIFDPSYTYQDATITMQVTLAPDSRPESGYGIIFRYFDDLYYNVFAVDGVGRYSIWELRNGQWRELRDIGENWTPGDIVQPIGSSNMLVITFMGTRLTGSVNGQILTQVEVTSQDVAPGRVGIYVGTSSTGGATIQVDSYQVSGAVSSMTGDEP